MRRLEHLHIGLNPLGDAGVAALAPATGHLNELCLGATQLGVEGLRALIEADGMARASWLMLWRNPLDDAAAQALAAADLPCVRQLNLDGTQLSDAGVLALIDAPWFEQLTSLSVNMTPLTDGLLDALERRGTLPGKATIAARGCEAMTDTARDAFADSALASRVLLRW